LRRLADADLRATLAHCKPGTLVFEPDFSDNARELAQETCPGAGIDLRHPTTLPFGPTFKHVVTERLQPAQPPAR
jgi:hypothetical protein